MLSTQNLALAANNGVLLTINNYTEDELIYKMTHMYAGTLNSPIPIRIPPGNATHPSVITMSLNPSLPQFPNACGSDSSSECIVLQQFYYDTNDQSSITIQYDSQSGENIYTHCTALGTPISHDICSITWSATTPVVNIRKN